MFSLFPNPTSVTTPLHCKRVVTDVGFGNRETLHARPVFTLQTIFSRNGTLQSTGYSEPRVWRAGDVARQTDAEDRSVDERAADDERAGTAG